MKHSVVERGLAIGAPPVCIRFHHLIVNTRFDEGIGCAFDVQSRNAYCLENNHSDFEAGLWLFLNIPHFILPLLLIIRFQI